MLNVARGMRYHHKWYAFRNEKYLQGAETATTLSIGSERGGSSSEKLAVISILSCMAADVDAMLPGSSITVSGMPKLLACLRIFSGVCGTLAIEI